MHRPIAPERLKIPVITARVISIIGKVSSVAFTKHTINTAAMIADGAGKLSNFPHQKAEQNKLCLFYLGTLQ
jgi:hypothetical protein